MYPTATYPGYGSFVKNICDELTQHGIEISCKSVIKGRGKNALAKLLKYIKFYFSIIFNYFKNYDFIYLHFPNQAAPVLNLLMKIKKKKLVVNFHGEDLLYGDSNYSRLLGKEMERLCHNYADAIVVPSEYYKRLVLQNDSLKNIKHLIVSPSGGINADYFYADSPKTSIGKPIKLGYVGRLETDKGIDIFMHTLQSLKSKEIPFKAYVIGYGSRYDWVVDFAHQYLASEDIEIIQGMSQSKLGQYYRDFDLLIFCSSRASESLGLTGIESMACATPVIGGNVGGIESYLIDNYNGWIANPTDTQQALEIILRYLDLDNKEIANISKHCIDTGKEFYAARVGKRLAEQLKSNFKN